RALAQIELHVRAHPCPCAAMPGVAIVALHRLWSSSAIGLEERRRHVLVLFERLATGGRIRRQRAFERGPAWKALLARQRQLHVPQCWRLRNGGKRSREPRASVTDVLPKLGEPALGFLLQTIEIAAWGLAGHDTLLQMRLRSAEYRQEEGPNDGRTNRSGWEGSLAADRRRPIARRRDSAAGWGAPA